MKITYLFAGVLILGFADAAVADDQFFVFIQLKDRTAALSRTRPRSTARRSCKSARRSCKSASKSIRPAKRRRPTSKLSALTHSDFWRLSLGRVHIGGGDCWMRSPPVVWDLHFGPYDQSALVREHLPRREPTALQRERREGRCTEHVP